jgi:hypothetical protein
MAERGDEREAKDKRGGGEPPKPPPTIGTKRGWGKVRSRIGILARPFRRGAPAERA